MRRRSERGRHIVPQELATYDEARWGVGSIGVRAWIDARKAYWALHPDAWNNIIEVVAPAAEIRKRQWAQRGQLKG